MSTRRHFRSSLALLLAGVVGCASAPIKVSPQLPETYQLGETAKGSACGVLIFGLIPAGVNSRTRRAYEAAIDGRGSGLTDVKLSYSWWVIPAVGLLLCTDVEGKVVL